MSRHAFLLAALALLPACETTPPTSPPEPPALPAVAPPALASVAEGERLFGKKGCSACHTIDGAPLVGPTMQGYFGSTVATNKGARVVDAAFVSESILAPQAVITSGFNPLMPSYMGQLQPTQVESLTMYLMSLSLPSSSTSVPVTP